MSGGRSTGGASAATGGEAPLRFRTPPTLHFGRGAVAKVADALAELGVERPLVVTDPGVLAAGHPERVRQLLAAGRMTPTVWDGSAPEPDESQVESCRQALEAGGHDGVVAVGGGSVMDVAKVAAALWAEDGRVADYWGFDKVTTPGLPLVLLPTTAGGGGEVSSHAVIIGLQPRKKEIVAGIHLLPRVTVVDPELTLTLPPQQAVHTALDGLVHAIEAYAARRATPFTDLFAREAVPRLTRALPRVVADPRDPAAREELSLGGLYSGLAMANANAGAVHALGYPLTGRYGIPHGLANGLMAAGTLARTYPGAAERYDELAGLFADGAGPPGTPLAERMRRFLAAVGVEDTLAAWGVEEEHLPALAESATLFRPVLHNTPVTLDQADLLAVYRAVWAEA